MRGIFRIRPVNKNEILRTEILKADRHLNFPVLSIEEKLAAACRMLFKNGHDSMLSGQVSARVADNCILTQRLGLGLDEIYTDNLLIVNRELEVVSGTGMPNPANRFHFSLYDARPDVHCIVHTHAFYASTLSMLGVPLIISHMDSCLLYEKVGFLPEWPGVPVSSLEGELFASTIGQNKALLLAHHGLLVVAGSVEEAFVLAVKFERAAKMQLSAMAAGVIQSVDAVLAREARDWVSQPKRIQASYAYYWRKAFGC